ncbi:hypothetical protein CH63R_02427 [Colletotrichum higginsianum IMI 349063]|uniref:Uncharacterized protein n=1 Tax=Colletotrichum higginsianum (strain IMI 349063) TaxID=759273 RepID=A0A1B7YNR3_COLHI|nr:hypothetical protein CH63R_02427 [Colletotrichum higginsianum IMI 349063]OBR13701.1 hypothetical protein CH63R_02427 [Colletotrichum higginsianum IMI 349063]
MSLPASWVVGVGAVRGWEEGLAHLPLRTVTLMLPPHPGNHPQPSTVPTYLVRTIVVPVTSPAMTAFNIIPLIHTSLGHVGARCSNLTGDRAGNTASFFPPSFLLLGFLSFCPTPCSAYVVIRSSSFLQWQKRIADCFGGGGGVIAVDTDFCSEAVCEAIPNLQPESWGSLDNTAEPCSGSKEDTGDMQYCNSSSAECFFAFVGQ